MRRRYDNGGYKRYSAVAVTAAGELEELMVLSPGHYRPKQHRALLPIKASVNPLARVDEMRRRYDAGEYLSMTVVGLTCDNKVDRVELGPPISYRLAAVS